MCLIIHNPNGAKYSERELRNAHRTNDDGVGVMWLEGGKVQTYHGLISEDELVKIMAEFTGTPHALHLRFATNGPPVVELCHPFKASPDDADQGLWLMHNGVMMKYGRMAEDHESDTSVFAKCVAADIANYAEGTDLILNDEYIEYLTAEISGDKMIFMRDDGKVVVLNHERWHEDKKTGMLYSNLYSIADRPRYGYSSYGYGSSYGSSLAAATSTPAKSAKESAAAMCGLSEEDYDWYFGKSDSEPPDILTDEDFHGHKVEVPEEGKYKLYFKFINDEAGSGSFVFCTEEESDIDMDAAEYYSTWNDSTEEERETLLRPPPIESLTPFVPSEDEDEDEFGFPSVSAHAAPEDESGDDESGIPENSDAFEITLADTRSTERVNDDDPEYDDIF